MTQAIHAAVLGLALALLTACAGAGGSRSESSPAPAAKSAEGISGTWTGTVKQAPGEPGRPISLSLKIAGGAVTGTLTGGPPMGAEQTLTNGVLKGDELSFDVQAEEPGGESLVITYSGKIAGNQIQGTLGAPGGPTWYWNAVKQ